MGVVAKRPRTYCADPVLNVSENACPWQKISLTENFRIATSIKVKRAIGEFKNWLSQNTNVIAVVVCGHKLHFLFTVSAWALVYRITL